MSVQAIRTVGEECAQFANRSLSNAREAINYLIPDAMLNSGKLSAKGADILDSNYKINLGTNNKKTYKEIASGNKEYIYSEDLDIEEESGHSLEELYIEKENYWFVNGVYAC